MYIKFAYYFTKLLFNNTCNYFNHYWKHYCYYKIEFYINLQDQIHSMLQGTTFFSLPQFYWGWEKYIRKTKTQNSKEILIFFSRAFTRIIRGLISMYFTKKKKKKKLLCSFRETVEILHRVHEFLPLKVKFISPPFESWLAWVCSHQHGAVAVALCNFWG